MMSCEKMIQDYILKLNETKSHKEIGEMCDISAGTVEYLKNGGHSPTLYTAERVLDALGKKLIIVDK